jgi:hypothetical protein
MHVPSEHLVTNLLCITVVAKYCRVTTWNKIRSFSHEHGCTWRRTILCEANLCPGTRKASEERTDHFVSRVRGRARRPEVIGSRRNKCFLRYSLRICSEKYNLARFEILTVLLCGLLSSGK